MFPDLTTPGSARSAAAVNEDIRALARAAWGRPFTDEERVTYEVLVTEWAIADAAERSRLVEAA